MSKTNLELLMRRKKLGLTQQKIADKAKINRVTYHKYENDSVLPSLEQFFKLCRAFDIETINEAEGIFLPSDVHKMNKGANK
jgi:DNA-binding XRE family transcriptional regulator